MKLYEYLIELKELYRGGYPGPYARVCNQLDNITIEEAELEIN